MNRIIEIALKNSRDRNITEDLSPQQLFQRNQPDSVQVSDINEVPIEPTKEDWEYVRDHDKSVLRKKFKFLQTKHLLYFVDESVRKSDKMNHHSKMIIDGDTIHVELYTHDMNDVSSLDQDLAAFMDEVFQDVVFISKV